MPSESDLHLNIQREVTQLEREFVGIFNRETIAAVMDEAVESFGARRAEFVPVLAARFARERLRARGQSEGSVQRELPEVLFVCVHNAGRSQMAAVMCSTLGGGRVHVRSAGSMPASEINPAVTEVMREAGFDLVEEFPKPLTDDAVRAADVVITMGCGDACPVFPGKRYLDWELDDPAGQPIEVVRTVRDEIRTRVEALLVELGALTAR